MTPDLANQVAIVTGAGRGIGRAVARAIAACGAHVVAAARTRAEIEAVAAEIEAAGGRASAIPVDLAEEASARSSGRSGTGWRGSTSLSTTPASASTGPSRTFPWRTWTA